MQLRDRIGRRMKLNDLHVLMAVVQAGSMNKAAALLNTTQPAISRSITELERSVGVRLLDRTPQGVEPTDSGRTLLEGGAAVFDELRQAVKSIEFLTDPEAGEVRIGSNHVLASSFVSAVVDRLSRRYPRVTFEIMAGEPEGLHRNLHERKVDVLVVWRFGPFADEQVGLETLCDDSYVIVAGAQNPWARRRKVELADLVDEPWVLPPPESPIGLIAREAFRASGLDYPRATVTSFPPAVRASLLRTGRFLTIFPTSLLKFPAPRADLKILATKHPVASVPIGVLTFPNRTPRPVAQLFIDTAHELAKPLAKKK